MTETNDKSRATIAVAADVFEAAMRLLSREFSDQKPGAAIDLAGELRIAHSEAGLEPEMLFWREVECFLSTYAVIDGCVTINIIEDGTKRRSTFPDGGCKRMLVSDPVVLND